MIVVLDRAQPIDDLLKNLISNNRFLLTIINFFFFSQNWRLCEKIMSLCLNNPLNGPNPPKTRFRIGPASRVLERSKTRRSSPLHCNPKCVTAQASYFLGAWASSHFCYSFLSPLTSSPFFHCRRRFSSSWKENSIRTFLWSLLKGPIGSNATIVYSSEVLTSPT